MEGLHPLTRDPIPVFIPASDGTDVLFTVAVVFFLVIIFAIGVLYLRLHALPEQIAHGAGKVQLQIVALLGLIALFTHNHLFWIAGLLLAFVEFPDFSSPMKSIARSLDKIAARWARVEESPPVPPDQEENTPAPTPVETADDRPERKE